MPTLAICITALLLCNYICSSYIVLTNGIVVGSSAVVNNCTDASQCPYSNNCTQCDQGLGPNCDQPTCINGQCGIIQQCSQDSSTAMIAPNNQCSGTDARNCSLHRICAFCVRGCSPACTEAICVNDQCQIIGACSRCVPTTTTISTKSSIMVNQCQEDGQCIHPDYCLQCPDGSGPSCASAKCVDGKCQIIAPCSQKPQCTAQNLTQCGVRFVCLDCKIGLSPPCTQVTCVNGQCKVVLPCSISSGSTTTPATNTCTRSGQCPHPEICVRKCVSGTSPRCASAKCVNGKCVQINPCSQRICKTQATCPYNKNNCVPCPYGYGPGCEQAACSCGICSIISPCSKRLAIPVNPVPLATK
jgi:hypothetical protein